MGRNQLPVNTGLDSVLLFPTPPNLPNRTQSSETLAVYLKELKPGY